MDETLVKAFLQGSEGVTFSGEQAYRLLKVYTDAKIVLESTGVEKPADPVKSNLKSLKQSIESFEASL